MLASQVISRVIDVFRIEVPLRSLFEMPTVADMAAVVQRNVAKHAKPEAIERVLAEVEGLSEAELKALLKGREIEIPNAPAAPLRALAKADHRQIGELK